MNLEKWRLHDGERLDDLNCKGYQVIQDPDSFCFGMDAVLLANYVETKPGAKVLDMCTGTGIIPILLAAKIDPSHIDALELQEASAERAVRSMEGNGLLDLITVTQGDVKDAASIYKPASFDIVTVNPPYMPAQSGLHNPNSAKNIARHEIYCTLDDVLSQAAKLLHPRGQFFMVHRPSRLPEILSKMTKYGLEAKRMRLVYPYADKAPNMVLLEGARGGRPQLTVERPLVIYDKDGNYTDDVPKDQ